MNLTTDNLSKSIKQLTVIDGWFSQEETNQNRYSLHLTVSFKEERLGGVESSNIHFRLKLRQCEVVVALPNRGDGFRIDEQTVARMQPGEKVRVTRSVKDQTDIAAQGEIGIAGRKPSIIAKMRGERSRNKSDEVEHTELVDPIRSQHTKTADGDRSWIITSPFGELDGVLWEPLTEPRFTVIDLRSDDAKEFERKTAIPPIAKVYLRCKREDLRIYNISFKDLERDKIAQNRANQEVRKRAAEAFLAAEIQRQGLQVGDLTDTFSDMTLAEHIVPLFQ